MTDIPFNKPFIVGNELRYIAEAVERGNIGADGHFTQQCARLLEQQFHVGKVLMTPSCTAALEMAAMLCVRAGDEVILPSFTFVSTANAIVRAGGRPVFVDIRPDTLNLDEQRLADAITSRTRAIFPVHYAGVACEMDPILEIARRHRLTVVEDAAQGVNAFYRGRRARFARRPGHVQLPRNEELHLWRRRRALHQQSGIGGASLHHSRQGNRSPEVRAGRSG